MRLNKEELDKLVKDGWLRSSRHPKYPLTIYKYTPKTIFENNWTFLIKKCRGIIIDDSGYVVARPFEKFFNIEEVINSKSEKLPNNEPYEVSEKLDGSLIIATKYRGNLIVASSGSFTSDHALYATELIKQRKYEQYVNEGFTYLFEMVAKRFRIIIDYKIDNLYFLSVINNNTGKDCPYSLLHTAPFHPVVPYYNMYNNKDIFHLKNFNFDDKEGFVIRFRNGYRVKIKFDKYIELHRFITGINSKHVWELLSTGKNVNEILENSPEESYEWVKNVANRLFKEYNDIDSLCKCDFQKYNFDKTGEGRKQAAEYYKTCLYPNLLFQLLDENIDGYKKGIWNKIKPDGSSETFWKEIQKG